LLVKGPIVTYFDGDGGSEGAKIFANYKGYAVEDLPCKKVTHAVVLIGIDSDDKGGYLIGRNSWGLTGVRTKTDALEEDLLTTHALWKIGAFCPKRSKPLIQSRLHLLRHVSGSTASVM